jgi:hypothetical protein
MRGLDQRTGELFSYIDLEARVRADRPLRPIRAIVNEALAALESEFAPLYAGVGRPSIPPEKLLRAMRVTPHVAQNTSGRRSAIDGRTTRHGGYAVSQRIEEAFGWIKTVAGQDKTRFCGLERVGLAFTFAATAYNLICLPRLLEPAS